MCQLKIITENKSNSQSEGNKAKMHVERKLKNNRSTVSIITLNGNKLTIPIKRYRVAEQIESRLTMCS
jgi:hypothetical protein